MNKLSLIIAIVVLFAISCSKKDSPENNAPVKLKTIYEGEVPCKDCPGIIERLRLDEDSNFNFTQTFLKSKNGVNVTTLNAGKWNINGDILELTDYKGVKTSYKIKDDKLSHLDAEGNEIKSEFNQSLGAKQEDYSKMPLTPHLDTLVGNIRIMNKNAIFNFCTDKTNLDPKTDMFQVFNSHDYQVLLRAYDENKTKDGSPVYVKFMGYFTIKTDVKANPDMNPHVVIFSLREVKKDPKCN